MNTRTRHIYLLLLIMLTGLAYCRLTDNDFIRSFDDGQYVVNNPHIQAGLTPGSISWAFTATRASNWHPLTWISHMLDWQIYGSNAAGHHLTSLLLHMANTVLLFLLLCSMTGSPKRSLFVAALFAVHPLHVESVAWVAERKDVLSTFFCFLTIAGYLHYVRQPSVRRYLLVILTFTLGLLSKPMLVSLPLILLLLDYWPLRRSAATPAKKAIPARRLIMEKAPLFALAGASCVVTLWAQSIGGSVASVHSFSAGVRLAVAAVSSVSYIVKTFWPSGLMFFYQHPGTTLPLWQVMGAGLVLAIGLAAAAKCVRSAPYVTMGLLWYAVTLLPVIGLVQVGVQAMADRYTYLPLIGPFIILTWLVPDSLPGAVGSSRGRFLLGMAASFMLLALIGRTFVEVGYWRNGESLFRRAIAVDGNNILARYDLGVELQKQRRWKEAEDQYREVLEIAPREQDARVNLALVLGRQSRYREAEKCYRDLIRAHHRTLDVYQGLAQVLVGQNRFAEAVTCYNKVLAKRPESGPLHLGLGFTYARLGKLDLAIVEFSEAARLNPEDAAARFYRGLVFECQGRIDLAVAECRAAAELDPSNPQYHSTLALLLYRVKDYPGSWAELQQVERLGAQPNPDLVRALQEIQRR